MARALTYDYDKIGDVLYLFRGTPYDTHNVELDERMVLRLDPKTHQVVGLMVHDLRAQFEGPINKQTLAAIAQAFEMQIDSLNKLRENKDVRDVILTS